MQASVRSAVTRTEPTTKNQTSVGRADGVSSRKYAPQKPDRLHPCKCSSTNGDFGGLLSHSLGARRRWDRNGLSATCLRDCSRVTRRASISSIFIHAQREGTDSNSYHKS
jgi:hypothetical protein